MSLFVIADQVTLNGDVIVKQGRSRTVQGLCEMFSCKKGSFILSTSDGRKTPMHEIGMQL